MQLIKSEPVKRRKKKFLNSLWPTVPGNQDWEPRRHKLCPTLEGSPEAKEKGEEVVRGKELGLSLFFPAMNAT